MANSKDFFSHIFMKKIKGDDTFFRGDNCKNVFHLPFGKESYICVFFLCFFFFVCFFLFFFYFIFFCFDLVLQPNQHC